MFLTPGARKAFTKLRQAFVKALILNHFDPKYYIQIETDVFTYAISRILNQLTSDDLSRWYPILFFAKKMIPTETWYETLNGVLLTIVEVFKTWKHYLEGCKHKFLIYTDYNNLQRFLDTKSLSFSVKGGSVYNVRR